METRVKLCEGLIDIILRSKRGRLPDDLSANILAFWKQGETVSYSSLVKLLKASSELNPRATRALLRRLKLVDVGSQWNGLITVES